MLLSVVLNVIVPGTGLILLGREWLGLALVIWFGVSAELAAIGLLLAPATVPPAVTVSAGVLAMAAWISAQIWLVSRIRYLRDPQLSVLLADLHNTAEVSLARGDVETAWFALTTALSIDASDVTSRVLWARLLTAAGQHRRARRAWRQAARLDRSRRFETEIRQGLAQLEAA